MGGLDHRVIVIPKSAHPLRIEENASVFDFTLEQKDINILDSLNENYVQAGTRRMWNNFSDFLVYLT